MNHVFIKRQTMQQLKEKIVLKNFKTVEELKQEIRSKMKDRLSKSDLAKITNEGSYLSIAIDKK